jgi:excisionase family DNA binding protein
LTKGDLISLKEAAAVSGLSHSHLRYLCRTGKLKAKRLGRDWFTTRDAVANYVADNEMRSRNPYKGK